MHSAAIKLYSVAHTDFIIIVHVGNFPFDDHCCHMDTTIKHPVSDRFKPSFVIFNIRTLYNSALSVRVPGCQKLQLTA